MTWGWLHLFYYCWYVIIVDLVTDVIIKIIDNLMLVVGVDGVHSCPSIFLLWLLKLLTILSLLLMPFLVPMNICYGCYYFHPYQYLSFKGLIISKFTQRFSYVQSLKRFKKTISLGVNKRFIFNVYNNSELLMLDKLGIHTIILGNFLLHEILT